MSAYQLNFEMSFRDRQFEGFGKSYDAFLSLQAASSFLWSPRYRF